MPCSPLCTSYLWVEFEGRTFTLIIASIHYHWLYISFTGFLYSFLPWDDLEQSQLIDRFPFANLNFQGKFGQNFTELSE